MEKKRDIDLTLLDWMLSLTLVERIKLNQNYVNSMLKMRAAIERTGHPEDSAAGS